jgi:predicted  nucleic acid-binding Zn ribbon protein
MKTVTYTSYQLLSCARCHGEVILCVTPDSLVLYDLGYVTATVSNVQESWDICGRLQYTYQFTYDESYMAHAGNDQLSEAMIEGVFCKGCLTKYIEKLFSLIEPLPPT